MKILIDYMYKNYTINRKSFPLCYQYKKRFQPIYNIYRKLYLKYNNFEKKRARKMSIDLFCTSTKLYILHSKKNTILKKIKIIIYIIYTYYKLIYLIYFKINRNIFYNILIK